MTLTIITDHKWHDFVYGMEVPLKVREDQFDHIEDPQTSDGFFKYRGYWYHLADFMRLEHNEDLKGWYAYAGDTYFSGVVLKVSRDGEQYMVGRYYS